MSDASTIGPRQLKWGSFSQHRPDSAGNLDAAPADPAAPSSWPSRISSSVVPGISLTSWPSDAGLPGSGLLGWVLYHYSLFISGRRD